MYQNQPDPAVIAAEKAQKRWWFSSNKAKELNDKVVTEATVAVATTGDAVQLAQLEKKLGSFAYSATLPSAQNSSTTIENKLVLTIANKGYIVEATLKNFQRFKRIWRISKANKGNKNAQLSIGSTFLSR
jgi:YidC/Oxa1 family membrane protein insertase